MGNNERRGKEADEELHETGDILQIVNDNVHTNVVRSFSPFLLNRFFLRRWNTRLCLLISQRAFVIRCPVGLLQVDRSGQVIEAQKSQRLTGS